MACAQEPFMFMVALGCALVAAAVPYVFSLLGRRRRP